MYKALQPLWKNEMSVVARMTTNLLLDSLRWLAHDLKMSSKDLVEDLIEMAGVLYWKTFQDLISILLDDGTISQEQYDTIVTYPYITRDV